MAADAQEVARAAVLGHPIGHSLSPVLHRAAYAELGLAGWSYDAVDLTEDRFPAWFAGLGPQWRGLSLTMPLKRVVLGQLAEVTPLARTVGAVNTVTWDEARRPVGENTDVHGMVEALRSAGVTSSVTAPADPSRPAVVLGGGATACSALAALVELGVAEVEIRVRSAARARDVVEVAARLGLKAELADLAGPDAHAAALAAPILVSSLPADAATAWAAGLPSGARPAGVLLDVTYHPWPTAAARAWTASGGAAVGGFEMLLHQAAEQVTLMTGRPAPLAAMRAAGLAALPA
jgi:shikimate dehydrogenase